MRGYLKWSSRRWVRTTLRVNGRKPGCSPIHARSPSATWFPERLTCSAYRLSAPPARATGAIRSRVWRRSSPLPLGEAGAPAGRLARRVRVSGLATFPKELTMNIEDEIINIRTTLARIEGRLSAVYSLPERVSMLEQSQAWLKGAWAVLAAVCAYIWKAIYA